MITTATAATLFFWQTTAMADSTTLLIAVGTVVSGALNSILTKYQDMQCVNHCNDPTRAVYFDQPVLQTLQMFIGEMFCWIPILIAKRMHVTEERTRLLDDDDNEDDSIKSPKWKRSTALAIPALCDLLATTLMNIGLLYTPVSIYQMTRGSVILIVGLMSVIFLKNKITKLEWMSLFIVFLGVFLVGLSGYLEDQERSTSVLTSGDVSFDVIIGMFLVFCGITITAVQFVIEEHILKHLDVKPIEVVGYQGFYGTLILFHAMMFGKVLYGKGYFDVDESFREMFSNSTVLYTSFLIMISISVFNFCGITLTKMINATSRSTIDTSRTLLVWLISMSFGWESYHHLQLLAFTLLVTGTLSFNGVIQPEAWSVVPEWLKDLEIEAVM